MRSQVTSAPQGQQAAAEELSWDDLVPLHAESRAPRDDEPARGFLLRLHTDPTCASRLVPDGSLVGRKYESAKAEAMCGECTADLVAQSHSSVPRRLRDAERTLLNLQSRQHDGPMPKEIVHCRALRFEAESAVSVHPDVPETAARVADLASEVAEALREAMAAYDRRR